jgi:hypothetical protein
MRLRQVTFRALSALLFIGILALPASAQTRIERQLALTPGGQFILSTEGGGVVVSGDSPAGARIVITSEREDLGQRFDIQFEERAGEARVTMKRRESIWNSGLWGRFRGGITIEVHLPRAANIDVRTSGGSIAANGLVGSTRVNTSGGGIRLESLEGSVNGHTSGGSIRVRQVRGNVNVETSGGSITVSDVTGDLVADTSGGTVEVSGAGGRVDAHSSGGGIRVAFSAGNSRGGDISTSGGGVRAEIDPSVPLSIDASSSGGGVSSDVGVTVRGGLSRRALRGDMNGGGALLRLRTSGGGVSITAARAVAAR